MLPNGFSWVHLLIILVVVIILFGAKRLPDAARGVGKSLRIFKSEAKAMRDENKDKDDESADGEAQAAPPAQLPQSTSNNGASAAQPSAKQKDDVQS